MVRTIANGESAAPAAGLTAPAQGRGNVVADAGWSSDRPAPKSVPKRVPDSADTTPGKAAATLPSLALASQKDLQKAIF